MKGNRTNHPLKFARAEDLKELKERFIKFVDNDFMSLTHKVNFLGIKISFILGFIALILALLAIILVMSVI